MMRYMITSKEENYQSGIRYKSKSGKPIFEFFENMREKSVPDFSKIKIFKVNVDGTIIENNDGKYCSEVFIIQELSRSEIILLVMIGSMNLHFEEIPDNNSCLIGPIITTRVSSISLINE